MAEIKTPHTNIVATHSGYDNNTGEHTYIFKNTVNDAQETVTNSYDPDQLKRFLNVDWVSPRGQELGQTLSPVFKKLQYKDQRSFLERGINPTIRSIPAFFVGGPWDIASLLSYVPGPDTLIAMGYEAVTGDTPEMLERSRKMGKLLRKDVKEKYGTEAVRRRFEQNLRAADRYAEDTWGFKPFEATLGTDMTPEARNIWEKMTTTGLEFAVSGPVMIKGVTLPAKVLQEGAKFIYARLAKESVNELGKDALNPANVRSLIDKANDAYSVFTKTGRRNIAAEAAFGGSAGIATEASLAALEKADPDAADWVKSTVAVGSGLLFPLAARSVYTGFLEGPVSRVVTSVTDPLFRPGTSAARYTQAEGMGKSREDRAAIASVAKILEDSIADGRHVDQASGLAFTTPELLRTEANILRARIQDNKALLDQETNPDIRSRLEKGIEKDSADVGSLNRFATFQENVLISAGRDASPGIVAKFFKNESDRLVKRREQFFNFIENTFKKSIDDLDFGGKPGGTAQELNLDYSNAKNTGAVPEFESTRRKLVMESDPKGIEGSELTWLDPQTKNRVDTRREELSSRMEEAFADAQKAAEERVQFWQNSIQSYLADRGLKSVSDLPDAEKKFVGDLVRGTYDDANREFRAFEKAAYRRIEGLDDKVTENIVFPEGSVDPANGANISGLSVENWAAGRLTNLSRQERFNIKEVPVELAQLSGSRSVLQELNRQRAEAVAAGRANQAQSRIPDLEKQRDEIIKQKTKAESELDDQIEVERIDSERLTRSLESYVQDSMANLNDSQKQAVLSFSTDPAVPWSTLTIKEAKERAPVGLENVFAQVAKQRKIIANLGEGTTSSKAVRDKRKEVLRLGKEAQEYQSEIDKITRDLLGTGDDVVIEPTGRLTSRDSDGALIAGGVSANDVRETISNIAESARREVALNGKTPKYRSLLQLRQTIEQLLSPETFSTLDPVALNFAREASRLKNRIDDAQGDVLAKDKGSAVKIPVEEVPAKVLPESTSPLTQTTNLRLLNEATTELPDFVTIKRSPEGEILTDAEGIPLAAIDEDALLGGPSLFDRSDSPFELVKIGQADSPFEIRLKPDAPVGPKSLQVAESILLERLALRFPEGVDSKGLESFRSKNKEALDFLKNNGRSDVPDLLNDADGLAAQLDALNTLRTDKARQQITELVNNGQLDLNGLTIDDYLDYIGQRRKRVSEENVFSDVIKADAGYATESLFDRVLNPNNKQPKRDLNEFLSSVRGNKPAEKGFQASIIGELFRRSSLQSDDLARQAGDLSATVFDPASFRDLMSNPRIRSLLQEAFPDNPELLEGLDKVAKVAFETSTFTPGSTRLQTALNPQDAISVEGWNNLGRILGLQVADRIGFVNSLVAAGVGSRMFGKIGKNITGNKIKDILINSALDPEIAVGLAKRTSEIGDGFFKTIIKGLIDTVNVPKTVLTKPAATVPILKRGQEELDEDLDVTSAPPTRRVASASPPLRAPAAASALSQVSPVAPATMAQAPQAPQQTMARLEQLGLPLFAKDGGIMTIKKRTRQIVG